MASPGEVLPRDCEAGAGGGVVGGRGDALAPGTGSPARAGFADGVAGAEATTWVGSSTVGVGVPAGLDDLNPSRVPGAPLAATRPSGGEGTAGMVRRGEEAAGRGP